MAIVFVIYGIVEIILYRNNILCLEKNLLKSSSSKNVRKIENRSNSIVLFIKHSHYMDRRYA